MALHIVVASPKHTRPYVTLMNREKLYRLGYHKEVAYVLHEETTTYDYFTLKMTISTANAFLRDLPSNFHVELITLPAADMLIYSDKPVCPPQPLEPILKKTYWLAMSYKKTPPLRR